MARGRIMNDHFPLVGTYSIVAFDPASGDLGVAVQSKFFGVGTVVPWARAGVGAVATQSSANLTYGARGLDLLANGSSPEQAVRLLTETDDGREHRQLGIVDAQGRAASYTGAKCNAWAGHLVRPNFAVQGNILAGETVVQAMAAAFQREQKSEGSQLADWLMAALHAGESEGGDTRGRQSAALLVVREHGGYGRVTDRFIDLRVDDHPDPNVELSRLLTLHKRFYPGLHRSRPTR